MKLKFCGRIILMTLALCYAITLVMPPAIDWTRHFRSAAREILQGRSPYVRGYYSPPWAAMILAPLAALPLGASRASLLIISLIALAFLAYQLGASHLTMALFMLSPPVLAMLYAGQMEWLAFLGLLLPPHWGVFLLLIKPQATIGVLLYWAIMIWREDKSAFKCAFLKTFLPVTGVLLASFMRYGFWPVHALEAPALPWNISPFPWLVPLGLLLLAWAIRDRDIRLAVAASPCLSPYLMAHSMIAVLFPAFSSCIAMAISAVAIWIGALLT